MSARAVIGESASAVTGSQRRASGSRLVKKCTDGTVLHGVDEPAAGVGQWDVSTQGTRRARGVPRASYVDV